MFSRTPFMTPPTQTVSLQLLLVVRPNSRLPILISLLPLTVLPSCSSLKLDPEIMLAVCGDGRRLLQGTLTRSTESLPRLLSLRLMGAQARENKCGPLDKSRNGILATRRMLPLLSTRDIVQDSLERGKRRESSRLLL